MRDMDRVNLLNWIQFFGWIGVGSKKNDQEWQLKFENMVR